MHFSCLRTWYESRGNWIDLKCTECKQWYDGRTAVALGEIGPALVGRETPGFVCGVSSEVAYNAGPGRYDEYRATARPLPAETRAYVAALTPILLGERPSGGSSSVVPPLDWREAAIFVAGEIGATASDPASPDPTPRDAPSFVPAAPETLTALQPEGLFVARSAGEDQP